MKSLKRLALVFAAAAALVGAAYAGWGKDLNIVDPISTGNLDMKFTGGHVASSPLVTAGLNVSDYEAQVSAGNLYPGSLLYFDLRAENTGTIPVKLANAELILNPASDAVWNYTRATCYVLFDTDGPGPALPQFRLVQIYGPFANLGQNLTSRLSDVVFKPGGWITFDAPEGTDLNGDGVVNEEDQNCITLWFDRNAPNDTTEGKNVSFTLKLNWKQFNK